MMMEQLFKLTELESRFPMNMNLLADGVVPRVVSLKEALRNGSTIAARFFCAARAIGRPRSCTASKSWPA